MLYIVHDVFGAEFIPAREEEVPFEATFRFLKNGVGSRSRRDAAWKRHELLNGFRKKKDRNNIGKHPKL